MTTQPQKSHPKTDDTGNRPPVEHIAPPQLVGRPRLRAILFSRGRLARCLLIASLPLPLIGAGCWHISGGPARPTDNADGGAETVGDASGTIKEISIKNNQYATGQVVYRLDPRSRQIALENAEASLAQTELTDHAGIAPRRGGQSSIRGLSDRAVLKPNCRKQRCEGLQ
jgi:hypothetical protein